MSNQNVNLVIKAELRDRLVQKIGDFQKENAGLKQNIRNNSRATAHVS